MWMFWVGIAAVGWAVLYVVASALYALIGWLSDKRHMGPEQSPLLDYLREELRF